MDPVFWARFQFAFTAGFHFLFPPLTIGMAWVIFWMMTRWRRAGDAFWLGLARFWIKLFTISFGVGVATGIVLEFEFGTNWADYSRFVGDIFGAPLAAEGLLSFFLESTFLGVLIFGWGRVGRNVLWFSSLMVALGATLSAFWIIAANSWMQTPAGFEIVAGRAQLTDFWAALFNPSTLERYLHTLSAALATGAFYVVGISARFLLRNRWPRFAAESLKIALALGACAALLQLGTGHASAIQVARTQPAKLASMEGLFETRTEAPLLLFGIPDAETETVRLQIAAPSLLSLLIHGDSQGEVRGLKDFPREERPPLGMTFYPFHLMVGIGFFLIGLSLWGLALWWKKRLAHSPLFLRLAWLALPLPFLANELGWLTAELGRQPWIVYGVLKTRDAISTVVPAAQVAATTLLFIGLYAVLFVFWIYLQKRVIAKGPELPSSAEEEAP